MPNGFSITTRFQPREVMAAFLMGPDTMENTVGGMAL